MGNIQTMTISGDFTIEIFTYPVPALERPRARDDESEIDEFNAIIAAYQECPGAMKGADGCACRGGCLGNALARLRQRYDHRYVGRERWWSDQGHCALLTRTWDSGWSGDPLNADNYWKGAE